MKIKYLLDNNNVIIAMQYVVVHNEKSKTGYDLVAENVELPTNPIYQEIEIDNVEKVHLGYSQVINGMFFENEWTYNQYLEQVRQAEIKEQTINAYKQEMSAIKKWLNDNDYIINKHLLGEYSDTDYRWTNYLAERKVKLARYNELEILVMGV